MGNIAFYWCTQIRLAGNIATSMRAHHRHVNSVLLPTGQAVNTAARTPRHQRLARNEHGRDFVVGDIHGMFFELATLLQQVAFDTRKDRIIAVGDLIDRGPRSELALEYLAKPWFFSVMGNHEQMLLSAQTNPADWHEWIERNGGQWWRNLAETSRRQFLTLVPMLPIALEVPTANGLIGIVHADVPQPLSWPEFTRALSTDSLVVLESLWSRKRLLQQHRYDRLASVAGIDAVICGHTPVQTVSHFGNFYYVDTGAAYWPMHPQAKLSLLEIQPDFRQFSLACPLATSPGGGDTQR